MYYLLKNLTATQQIGALFIIVFGLLLIASATVFFAVGEGPRRR